jgi:fructuronate reductase
VSAAPLPRLDAERLGLLTTEVARPRYDRARIGIGVVHLGIGAFHRAHQAVYLDDLVASGRHDCGVLGISLRHADVRDSLAPQDGLYTLIERAPKGSRYRTVGAVREVLVAPENPDAVLRRLADPATRLVTLTVTEKGYCLDAVRRLDANHADIRHDLATPEAPRSAIGFLVAALRRIRRAGAAPPTLLSCDNLPSNGAVLRRALVDFAALAGDDIAGWIEDSVATPCSMVDRIVPATTEADRAEVARIIGLRDEAAVVAEPFRQWVIEDTCGEGMPPLGRVGAEIVARVEPFERLKLRLLNGPHSSIAYLSQLAGIELVSEAVSLAPIAGFIRGLIEEEIAPTLRQDFPPERLAAYGRTVLERFANPAIRHRTVQIAMDGSQKLPQRLLGTIADRVREGAPVERLTLAVAAWLRFLGGANDRGAPVEISDPRAAELRGWADRSLAPVQIVDNFLDRSGLFPGELRASAGFRRSLAAALETLARDGALNLLARRSPLFACA